MEYRLTKQEADTIRIALNAFQGLIWDAYPSERGTVVDPDLAKLEAAMDALSEIERRQYVP